MTKVIKILLMAALLAPVSLRAEDLQFDMDSWKKMRQQKEERQFEEKTAEEIKEKAAEETEEKEKAPVTPGQKPLIPKARLDLDLPAESRGELAVSGRKTINMKFGKVFYRESDPKKRTISAGGMEGFAMDMDQQLQMKIKGKVGRKIDVNINYDDKQGDLNRRNIQIQYTGDPDEFVQKVQFGDITLSLPGTEFVGYSGKAGLNKNLFGFMGSGKYKDFKFFFVGSQTKGRNEVKRFTGDTTFKKPDINDAGYQSRKYYKIYFSTSQLPITKGSAKIWLDDKTDNNIEGVTQEGMTAALWGSTQTIQGDFDLLKPGIDYVVDYSIGVVTFYKSIAKNYVLAVDWENNDGKLSDTAGSPVTVKDENETLNYELKNRYFMGDTNIIRDTLGENFVVKILDNSGSEKDETGKFYIDYSSAAFTVDYDLGIIEFKSERPFEEAFGYSDVYDTDKRGTKQHFSIYAEYRVKLNRYALRMNLVKDSERIVLDGKTLVKDTDYILDYYTGWITFLNTGEIKDNSTIEATYEYYPFFGGMEQTLAGTRLEYKPRSNFFVGGTVLYNFAPAAGTIPSIYQTAPSNLLLDMNTSLSISPKKYFPFRMSFSGEIATSENNPNRMGKAVIENMEGVKQKDSYSTYEENWQPASIEDSSKRGHLTWNEDEGIKMNLLNANYYNDDDETTALSMSYSAMPEDGEVALVYPISKAGTDYSKKKFIEGYIWGSGGNEKVTIELGQFKEDADDNGRMDTEDTNDDGFLNEGEDIGVPFTLPDGSTFWWGIDNGRINTEDLDGDGNIYDRDNAVLTTFQFTDEDGFSYDKISWSGWKKIFIPLPITEANKDSWRSIKQIRITIKRDTEAAGTVKFAEFGAIGNKWEEPYVVINNIVVGDVTDEFEVSAINNEDDPDYVGNAFLKTSYYDDLYNPDNDEIREQALKIKYDLPANATAWTYATYSRMDMSIYKTLNFFTYGNTSGDEIFIRIGNDEKNYYEYASTKTSSGWMLSSLSLEDGNYDNLPDGFNRPAVGNVNLNNITRIYIGIRSSSATAGEIWLNDFYVSDVKKEMGSAKKAQGSLELPGWTKISGSWRKIDSDFKSLTFASANDQTLWNANMSINRLKWFPVSGKVEQSVIKTPRKNVTVSNAPMAQFLSSWDEGRVEKNLYSVNGALKIRHLPQVSGAYTHSVTSSSLQGKVDTADTISGSVSYTLPNLIILPRSVSGSYSKSETETGYAEQLKQIDTKNVAESYSGNASFSPVRFFNFNGNYSFGQNTAEKTLPEGEKLEALLQKQNVKAGVSGKLNLLKWLPLNFNYSAGIDENYQQPGSTTAWVDEGLKLKDINRNASAGVSAPFNFRNVINFGPTNNLSFNFSTKITDADIYKNVDKDLYTLNKFFLRDSELKHKPLQVSTSAVLTSYSTTRNDKLTASYKPFAFLNLSGGWTPLKTTDIQMNHTLNLSKKEQTGTFSQSQTKTWPDARLRISSLEQLPFFGSTFQSMNTLLELQQTETSQKNISLNTSSKYGITLGFKWRKYNVSTGYKLTKTENMNLQQIPAVRTGLGKNQSWSMSVNFDPWKKWHSNFSYSGAKNLGYSTGNKLTSDARSHTLTGKFNSDKMHLRKSIKVPLSSKKIEIDQNVRYNADFTATAKMSSLNVDKTNYQTYAANFSMDFDMSSNFRWRLGAGALYANYVKRKKNNYIAVNINTSLEIRF